MQKHLFCWLSIAVLDAIFAYFVIVEGIDELYRENSWAENLQVVFLAIACVIFARSAFLSGGRERILCSFFAMICFAFIFREIDFDKIDGMPSMIVFMLAGKGRGFFFAIILVLMGFILADLKYYLRHFKRYVLSAPVLYLCILAPSMLVFSHLFDRKIWLLEHRVFFEELAEMTAYCFMLCSALFSFSALQQVKLACLEQDVVQS